MANFCELWFIICYVFKSKSDTLPHLLPSGTSSDSDSYVKIYGHKGRLRTQSVRTDICDPISLIKNLILTKQEDIFIVEVR